MDNPREVRQKRGYSLRSLSAQLDSDPRRLSDYELGKRRWPRELSRKYRQLLGLPSEASTVPLLSWAEHRKIGRAGWNLEVDPGPTWADIPLHYEDLYRQLNPQRMPDLEFRSKVRADAGLEPLSWIQLIEDGAEPVGANPVLLDFPYPLIEPQGRPLGTGYRAAFRGKAGEHPWLLFPQITILLRDGFYRPDGLLYRYGHPKIWVPVQIDGGAHQNKRWDEKQDARLQLTTLRFPSHQVLGLDFARIFRDAVLAL
jgi:hypothetical protein